jgi:hypothetical protein
MVCIITMQEVNVRIQHFISIEINLTFIDLRAVSSCCFNCRSHVVANEMEI